jgi:hypothetical protein
MSRALLLSTALLLTACGGADDGKAAFVADAKAVCERAATDSEALKTPAAPAEFAPYAESLVEIARQAQQDLETLELPEADAKDLESRVIEPFADVVAEGEAFATKVKDAGEDQAKLLPLLSQLPDSGDVDLQYLRDYGLGTCADVISQTD